MKGLQERKYLVLLLVLVFTVALQPLAHGLLVGLILYDVGATLVVLVVSLLVFARRRQRFVAFAAALAAITSNWAAYGLSEGYREAAVRAYHALVALALGSAVVAILREVFAQKLIRADDILGVC